MPTPPLTNALTTLAKSSVEVGVAESHLSSANAQVKVALTASQPTYTLAEVLELLGVVVGAVIGQVAHGCHPHHHPPQAARIDFTIGPVREQKTPPA